MQDNLEPKENVVHLEREDSLVPLVNVEAQAWQDQVGLQVNLVLLVNVVNAENQELQDLLDLLDCQENEVTIFSFYIVLSSL